MRGNVEFDEKWMQPKGRYGQVAPESSRVSRKFKSPRVAVKSTALPRCMVKAVRVSPKEWHLTMAVGGKVLAVIKSGGGKSKSYSYRILTESKIHGNFSSLNAAVAKVLEKV